MQRHRFSSASGTARSVVLWCVMLMLPVYGGSAALAELLGALHSHDASVERLLPVAKPAERQELRRAEHTASSARPLFVHRADHRGHRHHHDGLQRHHHDHDDASVVALEPATSTDSATATDAPGGVGAAGLAFDRQPGPFARSSLEHHWLEAAAAGFSSRPVDRLERPPRA